MMKILPILIAILGWEAFVPSEPLKQQPRLCSNLGLPVYSKQQLEADFTLLVSSLKEAHIGLYWYATEQQFDSVVNRQKQLINDGLNGLEFYNIVAPVVAFSKEDHCDISLSGEVKEALAGKGLYLPLSVINLKHKTFILNNPIDGENIKGSEILAINGMLMKEIRQRIFNTFASDGFILSSKYRYLDFCGFAEEYAKVVGQKEANTVTVFNPRTKQEEQYHIPSVSGAGLRAIHVSVLKENQIRAAITKPAQLKFTGHHTAILTFRTFSNSKFKAFNMNFKRFVDSSFMAIANHGIKNLIVDMRDNGGGSEGNEDFLFSYLAGKPYTKYKYVEASGLTFRFLNYTDYSKDEDRKALEEELTKENERSPDGKYYRKPNIYIREPIKDNPFQGQVYVLTSGWTYSGGAEFSTLMKEHTRAVFIGEETGGGYFGNTSGTLLELTLPNTKLMISIPILKFVLDVTKGEFGRGVVPDDEIQPTFDEFVNGYDAEMEYAKKLIGE